MKARNVVVALMVAVMFACMASARASDKLVVCTGDDSARAWLGDLHQLNTFGASGIVEIVGVEVEAELRTEDATIFADGMDVADEDDQLPSGHWIVIAHTTAGIERLDGIYIGSVDYHVGGSGHYVVLECSP